MYFFGKDEQKVLRRLGKVGHSLLKLAIKQKLNIKEQHLL
jgi:hypothetical protein